MFIATSMQSDIPERTNSYGLETQGNNHRMQKKGFQKKQNLRAKFLELALTSYWLNRNALRSFQTNKMTLCIAPKHSTKVGM